MSARHRPLVSLLSSCILVAGVAAPALAEGTTTRVSVNTDEAQGNQSSSGPTISGDGRFVAFNSEAANLVRGDTNRESDTFVRDRQRGTTTRVSVSTDEAQGNDGSNIQAISGDGRFVAFTSRATNLVPGDTNASRDVFLRDLRGGTTRRVSVGAGAAQGNGDSLRAAISADGRFIAFASRATNLVRADTNGVDDVFVRDRRTRTTTRINVGPSGVQANDESNVFSSPAISADGRFVAFDSLASNLVPDDTNGVLDVFVRDRQRGTTRRVSVRSNGAQGNEASVIPSISADGRLVAFASFASNLVPGDTNDAQDVFVRDRLVGTTERVSVGPGGAQANEFSVSSQRAISADGRSVTFVSRASNLVPADTNGAPDVFVRDLRAGRTSRVSVRTDGAQGNDASGGPLNAISADGRYVAFYSDATNLVPGDSNGRSDVFVHDRGSAQAPTGRETMARAP